jgi:hypothetical protein
MTGAVEYATLEAPDAALTLGWKPRRRSFRTQHDWLKIHGKVTSPDGSWGFSDQSLTTDEAALLTKWLRTLAAGEAEMGHLDFTEPNLCFAAARSTADRARFLLRVRFIGECAPPWLWGDRAATWTAGYWLELEVLAEQLVTFAAALDRLLSR